jgi:hypothetical protein
VHGTPLSVYEWRNKQQLSRKIHDASDGAKMAGACRRRTAT